MRTPGLAGYPTADCELEAVAEDVWGDLDLAPLLAAGQEHTAVLALLRHPDPARWSSVVLDDSGQVQTILPRRAPHEGERYLFTGFQLIGAGVVAELSASPAGMSVVWEALRPRGALRGVVVQGSWHEVGSPTASTASAQIITSS